MSKTAGKRRRRLIRLFDHAGSKKFGQAPGTVIHSGIVHDFVPYVTLVQYDANECEFCEKIDPNDIAKKLKPGAIAWINVEGVHDVALVELVSHQFALHALTQEDVVNTYLRPQFETFPGYSFFALKMLSVTPERTLAQEHLSIILKDNFVITFQEMPGDVFGKIRERIRSQTGKVRERHADYLVYMLLDAVVDGYYQVVDLLGERVDAVEEGLRAGPRDNHLSQIFELRRVILFLRKNILPVRDLLNKVQVEGPVFQENTKIYLNDLSDHITQVTESLNLSMEMSGVLIDTYHSMQNQRLNAIMKTLTIISTIFLPLNFIAGVYGMNFQHMPELAWKFGYPAALFAMFMVVTSMLLFFYRKGWLFENVGQTNEFRDLLDSTVTTPGGSGPLPLDTTGSGPKPIEPPNTGSKLP